MPLTKEQAVKVGALFVIGDREKFVKTGEGQTVEMLLDPDLVFDCRGLTPEQYARVRPELVTHAKVVAWTTEGVDVLSEGN